MNGAIYDNGAFRRSELLSCASGGDGRRDKPDASESQSGEGFTTLLGIDDDPAFQVEEPPLANFGELLAADGRPRTSIFSDDDSEADMATEIRHAGALISVDCRRLTAVLDGALRRGPGHRLTPLSLTTAHAAAARIVSVASSLEMALQGLGIQLHTDKSVRQPDRNG